MRITKELAAELLLSGQVVAIPTETVYGLAASIHNPKAVDEIFARKGRPSHNPLIVHVANRDDCLNVISTHPDGLESLIDAFWPGPLTVVVPVVTERILPQIRANLETCAFRMPNHPETLALLQQVGPVVAPSANLSGSPSSTCPEHVERDFGADFPVLDGGACHHGLESTIVVYQDGEWQIARLGSLSQEDLEVVLGYVPKIVTNSSKPICPGQLLAHYAPKATLLLSPTAKEHPNVVGFTDRLYPAAKRLFLLGSSTDPIEVANRLYSILRKLDQDGVEEAWVDMDFADNGLWKTIKERLSRAASR
ncbi:MAG: threonylcarbamoyl-AMP synthase [Verrucomicrobia bacterium]|nr:threonylcarbamoyl-AMP synthase [Verrucomicrobiota bacterium]MBS0637874.1 threonylcarbamoyl-AMP synthase [Verrucomicrobiota bacterium]